ncbi:MAG: methyl-accepting chemotaxis protein, partial [Aquabacterium sp.]
MLFWFRQFNVATRLRLLAGLSALGVLGVAVGLLWAAYGQKLEDRRTAVRQTVEVAHALLKWAHEQQTSGKLSADAARQQALSALDRLRYGHNEYFWVNDMAGVMVHHPIKPQLNGKNLSDMKDPNGTYLFRAFTDMARTRGEGFVTYQWPKPGHEAPVDKVSYVKAFAPWGWVLGSGLYIDDLQVAFRQQMVGSVAAVLVAALLLWGLVELTARQLSHGVNEAVARAEAIAQGDIAQGQAPHPLADGGDEIARLLRAMRDMSRQLGDTLGQVRDSVGHVAEASQQIATGNQDLNHRTEQAAARLQHT